MHRALRRVTSKLSGVTGFQVVSNWRLEHRALAQHLRRLFTQLRIDLVLDVGANDGQYHDFLREQVEYDGRIVSFEPLATHVATLRERARHDPKWAIQGHALGRVSGVFPLNRMAQTTFSSFLEPDPSTTARVRAANTIAAVESVSVRTLAEIWPELRQTYGQFRPFLKMDTQGFDLEVLAGAAAVCAEIPAAQSELYFQRVYRGAPSPFDSLEAFDREGFDVAGLFPVSHDPGLQLRACDGTFVNRVHARGEAAADQRASSLASAETAPATSEGARAARSRS